ncbi:MAG: sulfatase-like hydrolase/transferase [Verrucomicrobiota bacterium]
MVEICSLRKKLSDQAISVFITVDDLRPALGCYGDTQVVSPNIDRMANAGVVFDKAFCGVAICGVSRASMFS